MQNRVAIYSHRAGLTIIPVMASLVLMTLFLGIMARDQVASEKMWRVNLRNSQARLLATSEKARLRQLRQSGQEIQPGLRRINPGDLPGLMDPVVIQIQASAADKPGKKASIKIPADADTAFANVEWNEP